MFLINMKYTYFNMLILYFKLVPLTVVIKILYNIVKSIIPTVNIIVTAMFLDNAVRAVSNPEKLASVIFPLSVIISIRLFNYYAGIAMDLISTRATNKIQKIVVPAIAEKKATVKFKYHENQDDIDVMNRATDGFTGNIQGFFDDFFNAWDIISQIAGFILVLGMQLWWVSIVFVLTFIPFFIISYRFGEKSYDVDKEMSKIDRIVGYISGILTGRDSLEERYMYSYTPKMNEVYQNKYEYKRLARKKVSKSMWVNTTLASMLTFISGVIVIALLIPSAIFPNASGEIVLSVGMFVAIVNAILGLSEMQESISDNFYSLKRKFEYLKDLNTFLTFEEDEDSTCPPNINAFKLNSIEFKNVSFKYPGCEPYILKNFNVMFRKALRDCRGEWSG